MAVNRTQAVKGGHFHGGASIWDGPFNLFAIIAAALRAVARLITKSKGLHPLTDSSGGTAGAEIATITIPPVADTSSAGGATVASVDISFGTIQNAYATLMTYANRISTLIGMGTAPVGDGTASATAVGAIDEDVAAASGDSSVSQASVAVSTGELLSMQATVARWIGEIRAAVGLPALTYASSQGTVNKVLLTMPALTATAAVGAGTSATTGVAESTIETALAIFNDNIAYLAAKLNECTKAAPRRERAEFVIGATAYDAGTSVWAISPCNGRIRAAHTVVQTGTTGEGTITVELATVAVVGLSITIATGASAGDIDSSAEIGDIATGIVTKGQAIEIVSNGTPTGGAVSGFVEIEPDQLDDDLDAYVAA